MPKGGRFELEICSLLSRWWSNGDRDDIFGRTAGSGGRFTSRNKTGKFTAFQSGDVTFTDDIGRPLCQLFNIECKTGYSTRSKTKEGIKEVLWSPLDILDSKQNTPVLIRMWEQCSEDSDKSGRIPLLIFRRHLRSPCIVFEKDPTYYMFSEYHGELEEGIELFVRTDPILIITSLKNFMDWISPETVCVIYNSMIRNSRS